MKKKRKMRLKRRKKERKKEKYLKTNERKLLKEKSEGNIY